MKEKVDYYLAHDEARKRIALAGLERTRMLPTPKEQMATTLAGFSLDAAR